MSKFEVKFDLILSDNRIKVFINAVSKRGALLKFHREWKEYKVLEIRRVK